jgi:D-erythritol 1-phosphate dehydrogenase
MTDFGAFDLIVVGGGVNGAGIARDAVGRGLSTLLVEKDDLAQGTSSRSGKLVHGGLRYLEYHEFRLVREALIEREVLLRAAPHIIWPMRFVLPHSAEQRPAWLIRMGLFLYDHLGGRKLLPPTRAIDLRKEPEGAPLKREFVRAFEYSDCWVDDARLVVLNALDANHLGARVLTRTKLASARRAGDSWTVTLSGEGGGDISARAHALINAAGPWVEDVLRAAGANSANRVRLVKGSHIVTRKFWAGEQAYLLQNNDKRVIFVNPYENDLALIGTTDVPFSGRADDVAIDGDEIDYLLGVVRRYFIEAPSRAEVISAFSGVRPLFDDETDNASAVTRDYVFDLDAPAGAAPLLSVFGGKITTYRRLAEHALNRLAPFFPAVKPAWTERAPLPGGDFKSADFAAFLHAARRRYPWLAIEVATGYARRYGTRMHKLLAGAASPEDLGRGFGGGLFEREARFLAVEEWAQTAEDILERRTKHYLHMSAPERAEFESWFAATREGRR